MMPDQAGSSPPPQLMKAVKHLGREYGLRVKILRSAGHASPDLDSLRAAESRFNAADRKLTVVLTSYTAFPEQAIARELARGLLYIRYGYYEIVRPCRHPKA